MKEHKKEKAFRLRMSAEDRELLEKNTKKKGKENASEYIRSLIRNDSKEVSHE